jgi:hypothetical protein
MAAMGCTLAATGFHRRKSSRAAGRLMERAARDGGLKRLEREAVRPDLEQFSGLPLHNVWIIWLQQHVGGVSAILTASAT